MHGKFLKTCSAIALFGASATGAQAAYISLVPAGNATIGVGDAVSFNMFADAADVAGILAGGLDLFYDSSVLSYNGDFAFDPGFPTDAFFSRPGDDCATIAAAGCGAVGEINGIAFGNFGGLAAGGMTLVGSLSFTGISNGLSVMTMADNDFPAGSWYDVSSNLIDMEYVPATVVVSAIPLPAAMWLFGSGLLGLIGVARTRS